MKKKLVFFVTSLTIFFTGLSVASCYQIGNSNSLAGHGQSAVHSGSTNGKHLLKKLPEKSPAKNTENSQNSTQPVIVHVDAQSQQPELYNGCEVTSLSMLLQAAGHPVSKIDLADQVEKDPTDEVRDQDGHTVSWGDPNDGFVGDITGQDRGYGVYHGPIAKLLNQILPGRADDLTGSKFDQVLQKVAEGKPVVVWTTVDFTPSSDWITWQGPHGPVRATLDEHVVLLVGYNQNQVFINDPLDGTAAKAVDRAPFEEAWQQLGEQAVTFKSS